MPAYSNHIKHIKADLATSSTAQSNVWDLVNKYSPCLYYAHDEVCYPIPIEQYLGACQVLDRNDPKFCDPNPSSQSLFNLNGQHPCTHDYYLNFKNQSWAQDLCGDPNDATAYVKVINQPDGGYIFVYIYLLSHTEPYQLCGCLCPLKSFAHKGDLKFNAVFVSPDQGNPITGVYYGAHGFHSGQYVDADRVQYQDTHPVAYPCRGDHSNYSDPSCHPRIFFCVYDRCEHRQMCQPKLIQVYNHDDVQFNSQSMGWLYFPGNMSCDGIASPANQCFWNATFSTTDSNNWFKRLFCCCFF